MQAVGCRCVVEPGARPQPFLAARTVGTSRSFGVMAIRRRYLQHPGGPGSAQPIERARAGQCGDLSCPPGSCGTWDAMLEEKITMRQASLDTTRRQPLPVRVGQSLRRTITSCPSREGASRRELEAVSVRPERPTALIQNGADGAALSLQHSTPRPLFDLVQSWSLLLAAGATAENSKATQRNARQETGAREQACEWQFAILALVTPVIGSDGGRWRGRVRV